MFRNHEDVHNFSLSSSSPQDLNDISQFLTTRMMPFSGLPRADEFQPDDDVSDDGCQLLVEKKRRLTLDQVRALEKSFESGNKLGSERKMELSRALGLKPRQITIWFQNRRARLKSKKLQKDYEILRRKIESIKADNDHLKSQNKEFQSQLLALERIESSCAINLNKDSYEGSWNINGSYNAKSNDHNNLNVTSSDDRTRTILYNPNYNKLNPIINVFPDSVNPESPAANITRLLHFSSRPDSVIQGHGIDNPVGPASNEPVYNIFMTGIQENHEAWQWKQQQNSFH